MKKIFLIVLVLICQGPIAVLGKTIITSEGLLNDSYLEEDNLFYLGDDVDWQNSGDYYADYYNPTILSEVRQKIMVRSEEELKAGISFLDTKEEFELSEVEVAGLVQDSKQSFFVYGAICTGNQPYQTQDRYSFAYLAYFDYGQKLWELIVQPDRYGGFHHACLSEQGIALIGEYDSFNEGKNIIIYEINKTKEIIYQRELKGLEDDYGNKIYYNRGCFYLFGRTASSDWDFNRCQPRGLDVFVGLINLEREFLIFSLGEESEQLYDGFFLDGKFYGLIEVEKGKSLKKALELFIVDESWRLNKKSLDYSINNNNYCFFEYKNNLLLSYQKNFKQLVCQSYDKNLELKETKTKEMDCVIHDYQTIAGDDLLFVIIGIKNSKGVLNFTKLETNYQVIKTYDLNCLPNIKAAKFDEDRNLNFCLQEKDKITRYAYKYYRLEENSYQRADYTLLEKRIFFNGKYLPKTLYSTNIPANPYGNYQKVYRVFDGDLIFYFEDEYFYPAKTNIRNGEVYDLGVVLNFNGEAFLNGKQIEIGTSIEEAGNYVLEIRSNNGFVAFIFSVSALSEVEEEVIEVSKIETGSIIKKQIETEKKQVAISLQESKETLNYFLPSLFGGLIIGMLSGLLLPRIKFRRKKNV
ncbi:MAG: hypothetical protein PHX62_05840 [Bacilli bacterium]|nr:hypothetical protein [Bacilli bacterium]